MNKNDTVKKELPNPIRANRVLGPEETSDAKYDVNFVEQNKDGCASEFSGGQWKHDLDIRKGVDWRLHALELKQDGKSNTIHNLTRTEASYHSKSETKCDNCGKVLNSYSSENYKNLSPVLSKEPLSVSLKKHKTDYHQSHHFCDEACLASHLDSRKKEKVKMLQEELNKNKQSDACGDDAMGSKKK